MSEQKGPRGSGKADAGEPLQGQSTLDLPQRRGAHQPVPPPATDAGLVEALLTAIATLIVAFVFYRWAAAQDLQVALFDIGRFDAIAGTWNDVIGFVFASACSLVSVALLRAIMRRGLSEGRALLVAVTLAMLVAIAAMAFALAVLTALLTALGIFGLFFHSGDR